ncbi:XdhC family protein [Mesorhizobium sp. RP14(2022)]|uniref:XdhC family protein n=1 Tax=Mesorhizobium liriopis TaxID=2953882 RepID=A0ABT1CC90_9HYPH|nr:XdhC family protein [Mesorhizobium liriopis]
MEIAALRAINREREARRAVIYLSDVATGSGRVIREGDVVEAELTGPVRSAFANGKSTLVEAAGREWFLSVCAPEPRLVIVGAVHISQALAPMAHIAGFDVVVVDPRTAFATPERFPDLRLHAEWPEDWLRQQPLDPYTALAAVTHDPKIDDFALTEALRTGCFYVGALGSRRTHAKRLERFGEAGLSADRLATIRAPIGLPIRAASPAEIAVSILAEVIGALRSRGIEETEV